MELWKRALERPDCEIPQHVVSAFSPSTHTTFETAQSSDRWGNRSLWKNQSLLNHAT